MLIVLSGNTCSGKSSFGSKLVSCLNQKSENSVYINEQTIHSECLRQMFRNPDDFAYIVQTEFLIRRTTTILSSLANYSNVIVERFITDDLLFENYWHSRQSISANQHQLYSSQWSYCSKLLPSPDVCVFFQVSPDEAVRRLVEREKLSDSPEVPFEFIEKYVHDLHKFYNAFITKGVITPTVSIELNFDSLEAILVRVHDVILSRSIPK